ncbi:MAG TPA: hypothetical protein VFO66_09625 [Gemmatimonadaceae bacterium]|nr:hypothetical protein [Gemmatimonadaceae bacterium]
MSNFRSGVRLSIVASVLAFAAACGGGDNNADSALAADSTLNRDLALAGTDTAAQPSLTDVPASPAATPTSSGTKSPATKSGTSTKSSTTTKTASGNTVTKAPSSSGAGARVGTIPAGSSLSLRSNSEVCTNTNKVGDKFTATLNEAVVGSNGATIPAGATVTLTVTKLDRSENVNDPIRMEFAVNSLSYGGKSYALEATVASAAVDKVRNQPKSADAKKVIGGAAVGAIAGQVLGKNTKSTVIGAAAGAAAGAGVAAATANYEGCVRAGGNLVVKLSAPLQVTV